MSEEKREENKVETTGLFWVDFWLPTKKKVEEKKKPLTEEEEDYITERNLFS